MTLIYLLLSFSLTFLLKEMDGPFGILNWIRNKLISNRHIGFFFYKLFSCYYCLGFWCSIAAYFLTLNKFSIKEMFIYSLAGAAFNYIMGVIINYLSIEYTPSENSSEQIEDKDIIE